MIVIDSVSEALDYLTVTTTALAVVVTVTDGMGELQLVGAEVDELHYKLGRVLAMRSTMHAEPCKVSDATNREDNP